MSSVKPNLAVNTAGKGPIGKKPPSISGSKRNVVTPKKEEETAEIQEGSTVKKSYPNNDANESDVKDKKNEVSFGAETEGASKTPKKRVRRNKDGEERKSSRKKKKPRKLADEKKVGPYSMASQDCARDMLHEIIINKIGSYFDAQDEFENESPTKKKNVSIALPEKPLLTPDKKEEPKTTSEKQILNKLDNITGDLDEKVAQLEDSIKKNESIRISEVAIRDKQLQMKEKLIDEKNKEIKEKNENIKTKSKDLRVKVEELRGKQNELKSKTDEHNTAVKELEKSQFMLTKYEDDVKKIRDDLKEKTENLKDKDKDLKTFQTDLSKKSTELEKLETNHEKVKKSYEDVSTHLEDLKNIQKDFTKKSTDLEKLEKNHEKVKNDYEEVTKKLENLKTIEKDFTKKSTELEKLEKNHEKVKKSYEDVSQELKNKDKVQIEKNTQLEGSSKDVKKLQAQLEKINKNLETSTKQLEDKKSEHEKLAEHQTQKNEELEKLASELTESKVKLEEVTAGQQKSVTELGEKSQKLKENEEELRNANTQIRKNQRQVQKLERDLQFKIEDLDKKTQDIKVREETFKKRQIELKEKIDKSLAIEQQLSDIKDRNKKTAITVITKMFGSKLQDPPFRRLINACKNGQTIETHEKQRQFNVVFNKQIYTTKINMLQSLRTMGSMLYAHRNSFKGILLLQGIEMNKKRDVWKIIPEYAERYQQHLNSTRENQKRLVCLAKQTNYHMNGSFYTLQGRTQKAGKQTHVFDCLDIMIKSREKLVFKRIGQRISQLKTEANYTNLANVYVEIMQDKLNEEYSVPFNKIKQKTQMAHHITEAIEHIDRAGALSLWRPFAILKFIKELKSIKKKRNEKLRIIIPKTSFTFKLLQMESMRLLRRNGLKVSNYDKLAIKVRMVSNGRKKEIFDMIHQLLIEHKKKQHQCFLFERIEVNLIYVFTKIKKRFQHKLRFHHMNKTFVHRGLHVLDQMNEKKKIESFKYLMKLYMYAPESFWDWQNKGGFFSKLFKKITK